MKIHGTAKGGALSKKDFGVAFGGGGGGSTQTCYDGTGSSGGINGAAVNTSKYIGNRFSTGADPIGYLLNQITFWITTDDDGEDNELTAYVLDSGGSTVATSSNTINNNTLNEYTAPAWGQFTECAFTFDGSYTITNGDRLVVTNSNTSTRLKVAQTYEFASAPNPVYCSSDDCPLNTHQIYQCVTYSA